MQSIHSKDRLIVRNKARVRSVCNRTKIIPADLRGQNINKLLLKELNNFTGEFRGV